MFHMFLLLAATVFAQEQQSPLLGVCALYQAAYPSGHTQDDLSTPIFSKLTLPEEVEIQADDLRVSELSTEEFLTVYETQKQFCEANQELVEPVLTELDSADEELSSESIELLEVTLFEIAALLALDSSVVARRNLDAVALVILSGVAVAFVVIYLAVAIGNPKCNCRRRRALAAPEDDVSRLLELATNGAPRRALRDSFEIPTMDIVSACSHNIPSFVCAMSTMAVTHIISSNFCGGNSLEGCTFNAQYALGYLAHAR